MRKFFSVKKQPDLNNCCIGYAPRGMATCINVYSTRIVSRNYLIFKRIEIGCVFTYYFKQYTTNALHSIHNIQFSLKMKEVRVLTHFLDQIKKTISLFSHLLFQYVPNIKVDKVINLILLVYTFMLLVTKYILFHNVFFIQNQKIF